MQANVKEATSILQKQKEGGKGAPQKAEENWTMSKGKISLRAYG